MNEMITIKFYIIYSVFFILPVMYTSDSSFVSAVNRNREDNNSKIHSPQYLNDSCTIQHPRVLFTPPHIGVGLENRNTPSTLPNNWILDPRLTSTSRIHNFTSEYETNKNVKPDSCNTHEISEEINHKRLKT
jgi:hypothetical protein